MPRTLVLGSRWENLNLTLGDFYKKIPASWFFFFQKNPDDHGKKSQEGITGQSVSNQPYFCEIRNHVFVSKRQSVGCCDGGCGWLPQQVTSSPPLGIIKTHGIIIPHPFRCRRCCRCCCRRRRRRRRRRWCLRHRWSPQLQSLTLRPPSCCFGVSFLLLVPP